MLKEKIILFLFPILSFLVSRTGYNFNTRLMLLFLVILALIHFSFLNDFASYLKNNAFNHLKLTETFYKTLLSLLAFYILLYQKSILTTYILNFDTAVLIFFSLCIVILLGNFSNQSTLKLGLVALITSSVSYLLDIKPMYEIYSGLFYLLTCLTLCQFIYERKLKAS